MDAPLSRVRVIEVAHGAAVPGAGVPLANPDDAREIPREAGLWEAEVEKLVALRPGPE